MSDETTASTTEEATNEPAGGTGSLSGPERATALAKAALNARITSQKQSEADKQARIAERTASIKALLLSVWDTLGIDPNTYTIDNGGRPTWQGSLTLTDPDDPQAGLNTVTIKTNVSLHDDGLHFRAGEGSHTSYNQRMSGALPDKPPSDDAIGEMILTGWLKELQARERNRQETLDRLLGTASEISSGYNSCNEGALRNLGVRISALKPGDLPEPYAKNLAQVTAALTKASQRVEAKLAAEQAYKDAATRVKIGAARWLRRYAAWEDECSNLARSLTTHYSQPFTVYEIRYTAIGAPIAITSEEGDTAIATEAIHTLQSPLEIARAGQAVMIDAIDYAANPYVVVIGAFLDGFTALEAKESPATTGGARYYHSRQIGQSEYFVRFPPTMSKASVDEIMGMVSFPLPPPPFAEEVRRQLNIKITSYYFTTPENWNNIDPADLNRDVLELDQKPVEPESDESQQDEPIPF